MLAILLSMVYIMALEAAQPFVYNTDDRMGAATAWQSLFAMFGALLLFVAVGGDDGLPADVLSVALVLLHVVAVAFTVYFSLEEKWKDKYLDARREYPHLPVCSVRFFRVMFNIKAKDVKDKPAMSFRAALRAKVLFRGMSGRRAAIASVQRPHERSKKATATETSKEEQQAIGVNTLNGDAGHAPRVTTAEAACQTDTRTLTAQRSTAPVDAPVLVGGAAAVVVDSELNSVEREGKAPPAVAPLPLGTLVAPDGHESGAGAAHGGQQHRPRRADGPRPDTAPVAAQRRDRRRDASGAAGSRERPVTSNAARSQRRRGHYAAVPRYGFAQRVAAAPAHGSRKRSKAKHRRHDEASP